MPITATHQSAVPIPSALLNGKAPGYQRRVAYLNPTTGAVEGERVEMKVYNGTGSTLTVGTPFFITRDGDEETDPNLAAVATAAVPQRVGVAVYPADTGTWTWVAVLGHVDVLADGTTAIAVDNYLKMVAATSTTRMIKDGTAKTANSMAVACAALASGTGSIKVELLDEGSVVV